MNHLNCTVVRDLLPLYLEGLVSDETRELVEEHLDRCPDCRSLCEGTPAVAPEKKKLAKADRKILWSVYLQYVWYLFWPLLYAATYSFGWNWQPARLYSTIVGVIVSMTYLAALSACFDKKERREYLEREERLEQSGKGSLLLQAIFWSIPLLIPVVMDMAKLFY